MQARITNPALLLPEIMQAVMALGAAARKDYGVPERTLSLVHLRASQINGCSVCVDMHSRALRQINETDERLMSVSAWRDAPFYTDAERAALDLTEHATRLADSSDPVPDNIWAEAAKHYNEKELAVLTMHIAMVNMFNRINATTRQVAGEWLKSAEGQKWQKERVA